MPKTVSDLAKWTTRHRWPRVLCPECTIGTVAIDQADEHLDRASRVSAELARAGEGPWEELTGSFTGTLLCDNADCRSTLSVAGEWGHFYNFDTYDGHGNPPMEDHYRTRFVSPAVPLLRVPPRTPDPVKECVLAASEVVLINPSAAVGRLRHAVEALLDAQRVPKTEVGRKSGSRVRRTLHNRIEKFRDRQPDVADVLLAVKWIGNEGTHGRELSVEDAQTCARTLAAALSALYGRDDDDLKRLVREINRRKGLRRLRA